MATLYDAETQLIAELASSIVDIVPTQDSSIRFRQRSDNARSRSKAATGIRKARLFWISKAWFKGKPYMGQANWAYEIEYMINIWYPSGTGQWNTVASSDAAKIIHAIMSTSSTVTGVQQRWIPKDAEITTEVDDDDPWQLMPIPVRVHYFVNG